MIFKCIECDYESGYKNILSRHINKYHEIKTVIKKEYNCTLCGKVFANLTNCNRHINKKVCEKQKLNKNHIIENYMKEEIVEDVIENPIEVVKEIVEDVIENPIEVVKEIVEEAKEIIEKSKDIKGKKRYVKWVLFGGLIIFAKIYYSKVNKK